MVQWPILLRQTDKSCNNIRISVSYRFYFLHCAYIHERASEQISPKSDATVSALIKLTFRFFWRANRPCKYWKRKRLNTDFGLLTSAESAHVLTWDTPKTIISVDMTAYRVKTELACIKITILKSVEFKSLAFVSFLFWSISLFASSSATKLINQMNFGAD